MTKALGRPARAVAWGAAVCGTGVLAHAAPAATWLPGVRMRWFPRLAGRGTAGHVALTFDDGPHPYATPRLLDLLAGRGVRATFFLLGTQATTYPRVAADIAAAGHEIAVHGWDHRAPLRPWRDRADLRRAAAAIAEVTGRVPVWYRPPYGVLTASRLSAARACRLRPVLWTAWAHDWRRRATAASISAELARGARGGGTILLHDSDAAAAPGCWADMLAALPAVLDGLDDAHLTVGPLGEHVREGERT